MVERLTKEEHTARYTNAFNSLNSGSFFTIHIGVFGNDRLFMVTNRENDKTINVIELSTNENKYRLQKGIPLNVTQYHFNTKDCLNIIKTGDPINGAYENANTIQYSMKMKALENYYTDNYTSIVDHIRSDFGQNNEGYWLVLYFDQDEIEYDYSERFDDIYEQIPTDCRKWVLRKKLII